MVFEKGKRLLLVEDEPVISMVISKMLRNSGYDVIAINTGLKAVETALNDKSIGLVLMDIDLGPGINGAEAARLILSSQDLPIVFLTSHSEQKIVEMVREIPRFGYVIKNSGDFVLLSSIEMALELFESHSDLKKTAEMLRRNEDLVIAGITEQKKSELSLREREAAIDILRIINSNNDMHDLMKSVIIFLKSWSGCEAVGVRLKEGDDYPYFETDGFTDEFVLREKSLCSYDLRGQLLRDDKGNPVLDCMCGNIICRRFDASKPFFTGNGSFWSNCTSDLLRSTTEEDRLARTRNRCNGMGYESVALIPLSTGDKTFGLMQLNDRRRAMFTADFIALLERLGTSIAIAISEKLVRRELSSSYEKFRTVADYTYDWEYWVAPDGKMIYCSPSCERVTGYRAEEYFNDPSLFKNIIFAEDRKNPCMRCGEVVPCPETGETEFRITHRDGSVRWIGHACRAVYDKQGNFSGRRGSNRDITESREYNNRINMLLKEKEMLLGEVHHRIKNNMNTIAGLLMLQAASINEPVAVTALNDARSRVQSMMLMYDRLYRSEDYRRMSVKEYLEKFIDEIFIIFEGSRQVRIDKDIEDFVLDTKILFPVSIIINELVTNSFKYAFPDKRAGVISVSVKRDGNTVNVIHRDDGVGIPESIVSSNAGGFGLNLVSALAGQIDGDVRIRRDNGTVIELNFTIE